MKKRAQIKEIGNNELNQCELDESKDGMGVRTCVDTVLIQVSRFSKKIRINL
jgi:hypothetical protein